MSENRRNKEVIWNAREHFKNALVRMHVLGEALERCLEPGENRAAQAWFDLDEPQTRS